MADEYALLSYGHMIKPGPRRDAYVRALRERITPTSLVVDVGAGFGYFAVLAAQMGAEHVFAVDTAEAIHLGKKLAADNGVADRVTFVRGKVEALVLPRPADLIVSDLRGVLPFHSGHFAAIAAARALLAPGGTLLPYRDEVFVAPIDDEKACGQWQQPWSDEQEGVSLRALQSFIANEWSGVRLAPDGLLGPAASWATVDYATVVPARVQGAAQLAISRAGLFRGLGVWFDGQVAPGVGYSNHPTAERLVYGQALFPLERPCEVAPGMVVRVELSTTPIADGWDWSWHVVLVAADGAVLRDERHHSMLARPLAALVKMSSGTT